MFFATTKAQHCYTDVDYSKFKDEDVFVLFGKTALALNLCYNAASKSHRPVAMFEMEMRAETLFKRLLASRSTVELDRINKGFLSKQDKLKIREASNEISKVPLSLLLHLHP